MLINLSNHPVKFWSRQQILAANKKYNSVIDLPFPHINPKASPNQINSKAKLYLNKCRKLLTKCKNKNNAVHIMGELTFTFCLVSLLKQNNIKCVASTTIRTVKEESGAKTSYFGFVRFREY
jgi:hypothetical protein